VTFTPFDETNYTTVQAAVPVSVTHAPSAAIVWPTPEAISYGEELGDKQLNATAPIPGTFAYEPSEGKLLMVGRHLLSVTFTPLDVNIPPSRASVEIQVIKATPTIAWPTPAAIPFGRALSAHQLNATASVPGVFEYTPAVGDVPRAGTQRLSVAFTPADTANYRTVVADVLLTVNRALPTITWPAPAPITYGTVLGAAQANAVASVRGIFIYAPPAGTVLTAGSHTISATFVPADTTNYETVRATVELEVLLTNVVLAEPPAFDSGADESSPSQPTEAEKPAQPIRVVPPARGRDAFNDKGAF
jgi:hypothetical protein